MEQLRRTLAAISAQLSRLSTERKLLVGAVVVILVMVLYLVARTSGTPVLTELLPGVAPADQQRAAAALDGMGISYQLKGGKIYLQSAEASHARATLAESGQLPSDKTLLFENLIASQKWTNSRQLNEQNYLIALQNELARTIADFKAVRSARVILDIPEKQGLVDRVKAPSAAVQVTTDDGRAISQPLADAIAAFVAGSRAGLDVENIRIVDSTGRQWKATTDEASLPTTYLDNATKVEEATRKKVESLLGYIRGVVVAVTAQVDVTRSTAQIDTALPEKQGTVAVVKSHTETSTTSSEAATSATPGVEANQTADITRGGGTGTKNESVESSDTFEIKFGAKRETIVDPKGHPTLVAVSVGVPKSFIVGLLAAGAPAAGATPPAGSNPAAPDDKAVDDEFKKVQGEIRGMLLPHVRAMTAQANAGMSAEELAKLLDNSINISMIPADVAVGAGPVQTAGFFGSGSGGGAVLGLPGNLVELVGMGVLGLVALGMMVMMVRKAGVAPPAAVTAEELAGKPPSLETGTDLIGEAGEDEAALAGIEVDESQMQSQQLLEQVGEMVKKDPNSAARLLNRWINIDT